MNRTISLSIDYMNGRLYEQALSQKQSLYFAYPYKVRKRLIVLG